MTRTVLDSSLTKTGITLSWPEKLVVADAAISLSALLINSCRSIYLLHTGMTEGGGPLGLLVETLVALFGR